MAQDLQETLLKLIAENMDLKRRVASLETKEFALSGGLEPEGYWGINQIMNYPSLELADGVQPQWWEEEDANITLTEEDSNGEGITEIYDRVLKVVGTSANKYIYQRFVHADQPVWDDSTTVISAGCWVWLVTAGTLTMELYDNGGAASIATVTTTTTGAWVWIEINAQTVGTTSTDIRWSHSAAAFTFYIAMPMVNVGNTVRPWVRRGLRLVEDPTQLILNGEDNDGAGYIDEDVSAETTPITAALYLTCLYQNSNRVGMCIRIRQNGNTQNLFSWEVAYNIVTGRNSADHTICLVDDQQIFEWDSTAPGGDVEGFTCSIRHYWEWE